MASCTINAHSGEITDAVYLRLTETAGMFRWTIQHNLYGPMFNNVAPFLQANQIALHSYSVNAKLAPQLPYAGPEYADYFAARKQATLQTLLVEHEDSNPYIVLDGKGYVEARITDSIILFEVEPETPDRQILASAFVRLLEHMREYYAEWHSEVDLPIDDLDLEEVERLVNATK